MILVFTMQNEMRLSRDIGTASFGYNGKTNRGFRDSGRLFRRFRKQPETPFDELAHEEEDQCSCETDTPLLG